MNKPIPVLMRPGETYSVQQAAGYCGKSERTIRRLCERHGLHRQSSRSAPWEISRPGLEMALQGDVEAIELLRNGNRTAPEVRRYLDHLGLQI